MLRTLALAVALWVCATPAEAQWSVLRVAESSTVGADSTTTTGFQTSDADTLIAFESWYNGGTTPTLSDSQSNGSWTSKTIYEDVGGAVKSRLSIINLTNKHASAHTVTSAGTGAYTALIVIVASGGGTSDASGDEECTYTDASNFDCDPFTPSEDNTLIVVGLGTSVTGHFPDTPSGYTVAAEVPYSAGNNMYAWAAYKIQGAATAVTQNLSGSYEGFGAGSIGSFAPDEGGPPPSGAAPRMLMMGVGE
jgi:hypothetical protein